MMAILGCLMGKGRKKHHSNSPQDSLQVVSPITVSLDENMGHAGVLI